jgi:hypothetical protein
VGGQVTGPYDQEQSDFEIHDADDDVDDGNGEEDAAPQPTTLDAALEKLGERSKKLKATAREATRRRLELKGARARIAQLEAGLADAGEWKATARRALVEAEAIRQCARNAELVTRLVDLSSVDGQTEEELRLQASVSVENVLKQAPELRVPRGVGVLSPGVRSRIGDVGIVRDQSDWLQRAARAQRR